MSTYLKLFENDTQYETYFLKILKNNKKDEITFGGFIFLHYVCDRK